MNVVVIGGGVVGVTTAYYLAQAGADVTVLGGAATTGGFWCDSRKCGFF